MTSSPVDEKAAAVAQLPALLQEAVLAHQAGQAEIARPLYDEFLRQNPEHPTALQLSGLLHAEGGNYDTAIALMLESLRLFPQQAEVCNNLGNALVNSERNEEAQQYYSRAVTLSPRYADAWRNLGLCYLHLQILPQARAAFNQCLLIQANDAVACLGMSEVCMRDQALEEAIDWLRKALAIRPDYAQAHHNLGVCLRMTQKAAEAIQHYRKAQTLGLERAELYQNLASAHVDVQDITAAIQAYQQALQREPRDIISHQNLNKLLWEQELLDEHLQSYAVALKKYPDSPELALSYAIGLSHKGDHASASEILNAALRLRPDNSELTSYLAYTYEEQGEWELALGLHAKVVASPDSTANQKVSFARALLARQRPQEALYLAEEAVRLTPTNQRAIAYLGLCWRLLDDEGDAFINDYDNFIQVYDVPVSPRFNSSKEFNQALAAVLEKLHVGKRHPPEQTLRGGTQTHGDLFNRQEPEIRELVLGLRACVEDYIGKLVYEPGHPLLMRRSERFQFSASWSVRLQRAGFHNMHVHPLGWISSAYYVQVADELSESDACGGGIKFGESDLDLGWRGMARRKIQPVAGQLVLFPSYMWHGTLPFATDEPRMTVAFDLLPVQS